MSTFFVAEVSSNHHRDLERCLRFVDVAHEIGCDAVKFQQFRIRKLFAPQALMAKPELLARQAWELPEVFNAELANRAHERGIRYASTPFYREAIGVLEPYVDFFKVASYQLLWLDFLRELGRTRKPVALATGMATIAEVRSALEPLLASGCPHVTLLHAVSIYPTPEEEANLAAIEALRAEFGCAVGWSDHTVSPGVLRRAVWRWHATMVEFHLDLDGQGEEYGGGHCWLPEPIASVIAEVRAGCAPPQPAFHVADGMGVKRPRAGETLERAWRTDPTDGMRPLLETRRELSGHAA